MNLRDEFESPGAEWRSAPFWSWNDRLDERELRRQVREMAAQGMGGFFMHSRVGLLTPFLSDEWLRAVAACIEEGAACGLKAWLYDEDRWPSGFAGGYYPAENVEHRARQLRCVTLEDAAAFEPPEGCTFAKACRLDDGRPAGPVQDAASLAGQGPVAVFHDCWQPPSPWFNDCHYTDLLDADAVRGFLGAAYDPYDSFRDAFGSTVPGVFTDEPNLVASGPGCLPWTPRLLEQFRERCGTELLDVLPQLFYEVGDYRKARFDFHSLLAELFAANYTRQLDEWCRARGLVLTGHLLGEDSLASAVQCVGNPMRHYEEMSLPGVDHLGANIDLLLTMKQASSVAEQLGRERVLSELYGTSGWHFTLEQQKWIGDWEYALGVNLRCQHLSWYSMRGCRKRDYPPCIFFQQPWWPEYRRVEDYFARLGLMLTRGTYAARVLVLHPQHSAYCEYAPGGANETLDELTRRLNEIARWLCGRGVGWHFGDESVMARHARVEDGTLSVGQGAYEAVVIPPAVTLCASTLELLRAFAEAGGRIVAVEPVPTLLDGEPSDALGEFMASRCERIVPTPAALDAAFPQVIGDAPCVISSSGKVYSHVRRDGTKHVVFACNTDFEAAASGTILSPEPARFERWDLETGEVEEIAAAEGRDVGGEMVASAPFALAPAGSLLVVVDTGRRASGQGVRLERDETQALCELKGTWTRSRVDANVLVLDYCRYRVGDEAWSERLPVWKAQEALRARLGLPSLRHNDGVSLWKLAEEGRDRVEQPLPLELQFEFDSDAAVDGCELLIETPECYRLSANGRDLPHVPDAEREWHVDPCMRRAALGGPLRLGRNGIVLGCDYTGEQELETIFLLGDFGVFDRNGRYVVAEEAAGAGLGDWTADGYPFYAGAMIYETDLELDRVPDGLELAVEFDGAVVCRVLVNGTPCATLWHRPWVAAVGQAARPGRNAVRIELVTTLHNMFGPHHHGGRVVTEWVSAEKFSDEAHWDDGYALLGSGLRAATLRAPGRRASVPGNRTDALGRKGRR